MVVREVDRLRVTRLQQTDPFWCGRYGLGVPSSPGEDVCAVAAGGVMTLSCHDHVAVAASDDQRLMSGGVPRGGDQGNARQDLSLAVELLVPFALDPVRIPTLSPQRDAQSSRSRPGEPRCRTYSQYRGPANPLAGTGGTPTGP